MKKINTVKFVCTSLAIGSMLSMPVFAAEAGRHHASSTVSQKAEGHTLSVEQKSHDAWLEGKLDTVYLFNRHLNNFTIDPEVRGGTVVLTGKVESNVDKELAEQLALGVEGIESVTNRLEIVAAKQARNSESEAKQTFSSKVEDATLTAEIKTKLLANSETSGLSINVDTVASNVTLTGHVDSSAEKDLVEAIAEQVDGVKAVNSKLKVKS